MIDRLRRWIKAQERPNFIFMPRALRKIQARVNAGEDPDDIKGIEKLWLWRWEKRADAFAEGHRKFLDWCKINHPGDFGLPPIDETLHTPEIVGALQIRSMTQRS